MKNMKDKLIELIDTADEECKQFKSCKSCSGYGKSSRCMNYHIADHILADGWIRLPCKVGDMVYELKANGRIVKGIVQSIHQNLVGNEQGRWIVASWFDNYYADSKTAGFECGSHLYSPFEAFGKTIFLTKEEAEKALKERKGK